MIACSIENYMVGIKKASLIIGLTLLPITAVTISYAANNASGFKLTKATPYTLTLDSSNSPDLSGGNGSMVDEHNVTWEYHNASSFANGHITIGADGYFGVSSSSIYGYTGIDGITVNFNQGELWLLKSVDGVHWNEGEVVTSGEASHNADNWRYIRFYSYADTVSVTSVSFVYSCSGIGKAEDIDSAKADNVISVSTNIDYERTTAAEDLSPNSDGGEAIKFTKTAAEPKATEITIGFNRTYTIREIKDLKIEFDMKTSNINYEKTVQLLGENFNSSSINSKKHSAYHCTSLGNSWYHIEVPVVCYATFISGYKATPKDEDVPANKLAEKEVDRIKINAGDCIIDNLRFGGTPTELGIYNNQAATSVGGHFWIKVAWTGELHNVSMTFEPSNVAEQILPDDPNILNGSPFYVRGLEQGNVEITVTVESGYNHQTRTITKTLKVN